MPRIPKFTPGPSRLSRILQNLTRGHKPVIAQMKSLKLTLAARNDHWGARHFVAEELPRIRYANPEAGIEINKVPKSPQDNWKPELVVEMRTSVPSRSDHNSIHIIPLGITGDGKKHTFNLENKHSTSIFTELMDTLGGTPWSRWKQQRTTEGLPLVEPPVPVPAKFDIKVEALGGQVNKVPEIVAKLKARAKKEKKETKEKKDTTNYDDMFFRSDKPKTGAAAVLP
ncbi:unnamed protein product [Somion occarium]|uniref:Ribosomal protein/NADH dehydrogenase domain-containing protein n=1 Tax=Somion occarium TaxID=3059160 RepID=A0ABP1CSF4_9APHY